MRRPLGAALAAWALAAAPVAAQLGPPVRGGLPALDRALRDLDPPARVLVIGAHPDDEDTELLAILARGLGLDVTYLSLTRGEGGQNSIGDELGPALGVLRTEELLAARRLDGARQLFTRAYDFGFSKSLADTWRHWPRDSVLKDVVRAVRRQRPDVIVSIFSGTPRDGHGQHQAAGWAAHEAFAAAADPARFPELAHEEGLAPWRATKLYRSTRFSPDSTTLLIRTDGTDPADGRTWHQLAMAGRSLHRSQDMGQLQDLGPSTARLALVADRSGHAPGDPLLAGVPARGAPERAVLDSARALVRAGATDAAFRLLVPPLAGGACGTRPDPAVLGQLRGLLVDAWTETGEARAGEPITVSLRAWNAGDQPLAVEGVVTRHYRRFGGPAAVEAHEGVPFALGTLAPGARADTAVTLVVPPSAPPSTPYFLQRPLAGFLYDWSADDRAGAGEPFEAPWLAVMATARDADGRCVAVEREVTDRRRVPTEGEVRRPVFVVPRVTAAVAPAMLAWPAGAAERTIRVTLAHHAPDTTRVRVGLRAPAGWPAVAAQAVTLAGAGAWREVTFRVRAPAAAPTGAASFAVTLDDGRGEVPAVRVTRVDYPHIRARQIAAPATLTVRPVCLRWPAGRVAYVRGAADQVPEALRAAGLPLDVLAGAALRDAPLARYRAIVIGPRAFEVDSALGAANARLLAWVRGGGRLVVQYQAPGFLRGPLVPYPMQVAPRADRVTEEDGPVTLLDPAAGAFTWPNRLGAADWEGWVQERGLNFPRSWDARYTPLLALRDTGEPEQRGALLEARVGAGTWVYAGLSFFRQLPAGVPGAFRLFANLLGGGPAR